MNVPPVTRARDMLFALHQVRANLRRACEETKMAEAALRCFSPVERGILLYHFSDGYDCARIAEIMEWEVPHIERVIDGALHRFIAQLKKLGGMEDAAMQTDRGGADPNPRPKSLPRSASTKKEKLHRRDQGVRELTLGEAHRILGTRATDSAPVQRRAYLAKIKLNHPDLVFTGGVHQRDAAERKTKRLNMARARVASAQH